VAVPTREEFQQAIDEQLGKGVVQLDAANYIRASYMRLQHAMSTIRGQVPVSALASTKGRSKRLSALPDRGRMPPKVKR
jgi:hypothetical protein